MTAPGPDGPVTTHYGYDAAMNNTATIDPLGRVTTYTYDALTRETASYSGQVIDSGTAGYAELGSAWTPGATDKVGGTYDTTTSVAGAATAAVTWTFIGLTPGDSYQLFTSWTAASGNSNASDVPFSISYTDAEGNAQQTTEPVDESAPPAAGWSFSGQNFASLGAFTAGPDGTIVVQLSNSTGTAGQTVVADSVFLRRVQAMSQTSYDPASNVSSTIDALGNVTASTYDDLDQETAGYQGQVDDSAGTSWTFSNLTPNSQLSYDVYGYSASGTLTGAGYTVGVYPLGTPDPAAPSLGPGWYKLGSVMVSGSTSTLTVDGPATSAVCLLQQTSATTYDADGEVTAATDALGHVTTYQFDALGRQVRVTQPRPDGSTAPPVEQTLAAPTSASGWTLQTTGGYGGSYYTALGGSAGAATWSFTGLTAGTQYQVFATWSTGAANATSVPFTFWNGSTQLGGVVTVNQTTLSPDASNGNYQWQSLAVVSLPAGATALTVMLDAASATSGTVVASAVWVVEAVPATFTTFDAVGDVLGTTDSLGHSTHDTYDNQGRVKTETDADGHQTSYSYDAAGNVLTLTDPDLNKTTWTYDFPDRTVTETNQLGYSDVSIYDANGELTQETDRDGHVTVYGYDHLGRETTETWGSTLYASYGYDADGELLTASDPSSSYTYSYNFLGQATGTTQQIAGLTPTITFAQQFDADGDRTQLAAAIGGTADFVNNYTYADAGLMTSVAQSGASVAPKYVTFQYDADGQFSAIKRYADLAGSELVTTGTYGFDADGQMTSLAYTTAGTAPSYTWSYDAAGDMTQMVSALDGTVNYSYDATGQLTAAASSNTQLVESYYYDSNGNRETANGTTYGAATNNQLTSVGAYTYSYDPEGNCTYRWVQAAANSGQTAPTSGDSDITVYTWDNRNRLTSVTHYGVFGDPADLQVAYTYDVFNRWIGETIMANGTTTQTRYVYDGNQIVMQFDNLTSPASGEGQGEGLPLAATNLSHRYLWGPAVDQLLADEQLSTGAGLVWTLGDNQNTIRDLAVSTGGVTSVVNHRVFSAYGQLLSQSNPSDGYAAAAVDCLLAYTGEALDQATGLQNNLNRWYDSITGRWLSQDPIGFAGGDANLYRYCGNGPTNGTDPSALVDEHDLACPPQPANLKADPKAANFAKPIGKDANGFTIYEYPNAFPNTGGYKGYATSDPNGGFAIKAPDGSFVHKCPFPDGDRKSQHGINDPEIMKPNQYKGCVRDPGTNRKVVYDYIKDKNGKTRFSIALYLCTDIGTPKEKTKLVGQQTIIPAPTTPGGIPNPNDIQLLPGLPKR